MRVGTLLTLVFLCLAAVATDSCRSSRAVRNARAARNIVRAGAYTRRDNARSTPTPATADYHNCATKKAGHGDLDGAIADLSEAIRIDPDKALAYYHRGMLKRNLGDLMWIPIETWNLRIS